MAEAATGLLEENARRRGRIEELEKPSRKSQRRSYCNILRHGLETNIPYESNLDYNSTRDQGTQTTQVIKRSLPIYSKGTVDHPSQNASSLIKANLTPTEVAIKDPEIRQVRNGVLVLFRSLEEHERPAEGI